MNAKPDKRPLKLQPLAPLVRRGLELPHLLCDWHLLGKQWFERFLLDFYADLPTHPWEDPAVFAEGAVRVVSRLLQRTATPPFRVIWVSRPRQTLTTCARTKPDLEMLGVTTAIVQISHNASDAKIFSKMGKFLAKERKLRGCRLVHARPATVPNLKRDYVVFALSLAEWDIESIQQQLSHMGCVPFPTRTDPKHFVRKIRQRYLKLSDEIAGTA